MSDQIALNYVVCIYFASPGASHLQTFLHNQARITSDTCENAFDTFYLLILQTVN